MPHCTSGITCVDNYQGRGRYKAEEKLPNLLEDIKKLVDSQSQIDPSFKSQRLYTRLSAAEVRHQLIKKFGYEDEELPTSETIRVKLNDARISPQMGRQNSTSKKIPETDAIFEQLAIVHQEASDDPSVLRLSTVYFISWKSLSIMGDDRFRWVVLN